MTKLEAEEARKQGNQCMKDGKHFEAVIYYTNAIKHDPRNHEYYGNRSLALLKVDQYYHARMDAMKAIELKQDWPKAYFRKGEVEYKAEHYKEALQSYKQGLSVSPEDTGLQQAAKKASDAWKSQRQKEARLPWYGTGIGFCLGLGIIIADMTIATRSVLNYTILQLLVMAAFVGLGYGGSTIYKWFQNSQKSVLLEEPIDLFGDGKDDDLMYPKTDNVENLESDQKSADKQRRAGGRQRSRKGKS